MFRLWYMPAKHKQLLLEANSVWIRTEKIEAGVKENQGWNIHESTIHQPTVYGHKLT